MDGSKTKSALQSRSGQPPRVLVLFYSFSGQTRGLLARLIASLEEHGVTVHTERLNPKQQLRFPIGTVSATLRMMLVTLFRKSMEIEPLDEACHAEYDLIVLAGPTWSYNPSGPVLGLLRQYDRIFFAGKTVLPLISCRGYWRAHWLGLRHLLRQRGASVPNVIVFSHPVKEPWRTVGVFLKLAGKVPERLLGDHYPRYGHSREQQEQAFHFGRQIADALLHHQPLETLPFPPC